MHRPRFQTITPSPRFAWLFRVADCGAGTLALLCAAVTVMSGPDPKVLASLTIFSILAALSMTRLGIRIGVNDESLLIAKNMLSMEVASWAWITGFEWRHNLRGIGRSSERLWVILDDGQEIATPVAKGAVFPTDRDIILSDAQADAVVAHMDHLRTK